MTTYHPFFVSSNCCSPLILLRNLISRKSLTLSEHLTMSECGDLLRFPINSEYQFSPWSIEPIDDRTKWHSLTTWMAENILSGFAITSTIEERGWMRMKGYHTKNKGCGRYFRCQIAAWIGMSSYLKLSHGYILPRQVICSCTDCRRYTFLVEKNEYGLVDAILRIVKRRLHIITRIHESHELA